MTKARFLGGVLVQMVTDKTLKHILLFIKFVKKRFTYSSFYKIWQIHLLYECLEIFNF